jgi:hypothetical protein
MHTQREHAEYRVSGYRAVRALHRDRQRKQKKLRKQLKSLPWEQIPHDAAAGTVFQRDHEA